MSLALPPYFCSIDSICYPVSVALPRLSFVPIDLSHLTYLTYFFKQDECLQVIWAEEEAEMIPTISRAPTKKLTTKMMKRVSVRLSAFKFQLIFYAKKTNPSWKKNERMNEWIIEWKNYWKIENLYIVFVSSTGRALGFICMTIDCDWMIGW